MGCCIWTICCQGSDDNAAESTVENGLNDEAQNIIEQPNTDSNGSSIVKLEN